MSSERGSRRVHFNSPAELVAQFDAVADVFDRDRTDLLIEAMREYVREAADDEEFQRMVAERYYGDQLAFDDVRRLVGAETAQRFRLLKADLDADPLDLDEPADADVYDGDRQTVELGDGAEQ